MNEGATAAILAAEKAALARWSSGDPLGYFEKAHEGLTYFDDIGAQQRINGKAACLAYAEELVGVIPEHRYEIVDPRVQVFGDVGVLTLRYHTSSLDGEPTTPWKATLVYANTDDGWKQVHANWSIVKDA